MKMLTVLLWFFATTSFLESQERTPEDFSKEIVSGIEETLKGQGDGKYVLISFINGTMEIVSPVKPAKEWDEKYRESLRVKVQLNIKRGGNLFQLLKIKEPEKVYI